MAEKKKNVFAKAGIALKHFFGDRHVSNTEAVKHEKIMKQKGMTEFLDAVKSASAVDVKSQFGNSVVRTMVVAYKFGNYVVRREFSKHGWKICEVFVKGKKVLNLDSEVFKMVENRAKALNPKEVTKCEQDAASWFNAERISSYESR